MCATATTQKTRLNNILSVCIPISSDKKKRTITNCSCSRVCAVRIHRLSYPFIFAFYHFALILSIDNSSLWQVCSPLYDWMMMQRTHIVPLSLSMNFNNRTGGTWLVCVRKRGEQKHSRILSSNREYHISAKNISNARPTSERCINHRRINVAHSRFYPVFWNRLLIFSIHNKLKNAPEARRKYYADTCVWRIVIGVLSVYLISISSIRVTFFRQKHKLFQFLEKKWRQ